MKKFFKKLRYGEKGFTLIELLVVVAVLGVLAAVAVPNVGKFMGSGTIEAANTEAHNVQTAVLAYMVDNSLQTIAGGTVGPDVLADIPTPTPTPPATSVKSFITGSLQATSTIGTDGQIASAIVVTGSKWGTSVYTQGTGWAAAP